MSQAQATHKPQTVELSMDPGEDESVGTPTDDMTSEEMFAAGLISEDQLELHVHKPGEKVFDFGTGQQGVDSGRFDGKMLGSSQGDAVLYNVKGWPRIMPFELAEKRLEKRFATGHRLAGQRMFFKRPPVKREAPTFACPSSWAQHDRMFWSERQADRHLEHRHREEWADRERARDRDLQERGIKAAERQAELQEAQLEFLRGGGQPSDAPPIPMEPAAGSSGPSPDASKEGLLRYLGEAGLDEPEGVGDMSADDLRAYVLALEE